MKAKILVVLVAGCLLALAVWCVHRSPPTPEEVPAKHRETIYKGLEFLAKNQFKDGHWEGDGGNHRVAMTGMAGLALLMEMPLEKNLGERRFGMQIGEPKYSANIRKAADWLMDKADVGRDGVIFSGHDSETARYMEGHGLATLFLASACIQVNEMRGKARDEAHRKKLDDVLARAVAYIVKSQSTQGGWYHTSKLEGHDLDLVSATAIQIQALQAAEYAGISVPGETINDAQEYLKTAIARYDTGLKGGENHNRPLETAAALVCRIQPPDFFDDREDELCTKWLKYCQSEILVGSSINLGRDELIHYYYARALFHHGGTAWNAYRAATFDYLRRSQNEDGSWPSSNGFVGGPVYATAVWCTVLQLDNRTHPYTRRYDNIPRL